MSKSKTTSKSTENQIKMVNEDFTLMVEETSSIMPKLAKYGVIGVYIISALVMGWFHMQELGKDGQTGIIYYMPLVAALGVQFIRCIAVFFCLNNPSFIAERERGAIFIAFILMAFSVYEAFTLFYPISASFMVTMCALMIGGYFIEVSLLKEMVRAVQYSLSQNPNYEKQLQNYYQSMQRIKHIKKTARKMKFDSDNNPIPLEGNSRRVFQFFSN